MGNSGGLGNQSLQSKKMRHWKLMEMLDDWTKNVAMIDGCELVNTGKGVLYLLNSLKLLFPTFYKIKLKKKWLLVVLYDQLAYYIFSINTTDAIMYESVN